MLRTLLLLACLLFITCGFSQECNFPLPPSNNCFNAPLLCDLDGYCSDNASATNSGTPNAFCGVVENNNWVSFLAGSTTFILEVTVSDCNQGSGLQAQVFSSSDCQNFVAVSNCIDPVTNTAALTATNLEVGELYYLMIDGKGGDVCDYTLRLVQGETMSPANAVIEPAGFLCDGEELVLSSVGTTANSNVTYQWSTTDGGFSSATSDSEVLVNQAGQYKVVIEDEGGCKDSTEIEISLHPLPSFVIAEPDTLNCLTNLMVTLDIVPENPNEDYSYWWTSANGIISAGAMTATPIVTAAGTYDVVVTDNTTGCQAAGSVSVIADANTPNANVVGATELNCLVSVIQLQGTGSSIGAQFSYLWTTDSGNILTATDQLNIEIDASGIYELAVLNEDNGCVSVASINVIHNEEEPAGASIEIKEPCFEQENGEIVVTAVQGGTAPYYYSLNTVPYNSLASHENLRAGPYRIGIKDATGCTWDTLVNLVEQPEFLLDLGTDTELLLGCETTLTALTNRSESAIETISWTPDVGCVDCLEPSILPLESTMYQLELVDFNGCTAEDVITVFVDKQRRVFIPNAFSPNGDGQNDVFYVSGGKDVAEVVSLRIYNRWGGLLFDQGRHAVNSPVHGWSGFYGNEQLRSGIYVYTAEVLYIDGRSTVHSGNVLLVR